MYLDFNSEIFSWVRGGLFLFFLFHLIIYIQNGRKSYLYHSLYILCLFLYFFQHIFTGEFADEIYGYLNFSLQFLAYAAYAAFARLLIETRANLIQWDKYLEIQTKILILLAGLFVLIQLFFGYDYQIKAFTIVGPALTIFALISFFYIYQIPGTTSKYFVIGSFVYLVLVNISFLETILGSTFFYSRGIEPMLFMYLGAFIQSLIFASILGLSIKKIDQRSVRAEIKLATKLKEMEELKMTALQSQMNPHFLFNSLNSINNFVLKNEIEKASDYITKFSRLIRVILKSSSSLTIPLSEELGILALYVKLEQMRIKGGFEYIVNIGGDINLEEIKVPPLFLQPYIENSIWHGIMLISTEKKIHLSIQKVDNKIQCEVTDNGIGIDKTNEESHKKINRRKFFGTQATEDRIKLLHRNIDVAVDISDISDENSTGTKVTIIFPIYKK
jgi:sensor histidine kinase YesM